jgi:hypothetical protein
MFNNVCPLFETKSPELLRDPLVDFLQQWFLSLSRGAMLPFATSHKIGFVFKSPPTTKQKSIFHFYILPTNATITNIRINFQNLPFFGRITLLAQFETLPTEESKVLFDAYF